MITNIELVHRLAEAFDNIELTPTEVDEELHEAGYDPDEIGAKMKAIADEALAGGICCEILKEQTDKPVRGERIVAFDKAIPKSDTAVIVKSRDGKIVPYGKIEDNDDLLRFIKNTKNENCELTRVC